MNNYISNQYFLYSPSPLFATKNRCIVECNHAMADLFGYQREQLLGESVKILYPSSADYELLGKLGEEAMQGSTHYGDERFMQHASGEIFWVRARGHTFTPEVPFAHAVWHFQRLLGNLQKAVTLTRREQEVAGYIVNGMTCKEIARLLDISYRTVELYRAKLLKKLQAKNTAELVSKIIVVTRQFPTNPIA